MQQLIKFCLVGASSTVIDKGIQRVLMLSFPLWPWWFCQTISFCFGVTNGFFWNRRWTFQAQDFGSSRLQYRRFVATNTVGWGLNLAFTKLFLFFLTNQWSFTVNPPANTVLAASLMAIPLVVIWNFSASRFWTFRAPKTGAETAPTAMSTAPPIAAPE